MQFDIDVIKIFKKGGFWWLGRHLKNERYGTADI